MPKTKSDNRKIQLVQDDPWLEPYTHEIEARLQSFENRLKTIKAEEKSLKEYSAAYKWLGFNYDEKEDSWTYREWAPAAEQLTLIGEFDNWGEGIKMSADTGGYWQTQLPGSKLQHGMLVKVRVRSNGREQDRIPAYIHRTVQNPDTHDFSGQIWLEKPYKWSNKLDLSKIKAPIIYEAHIGMGLEKEGVGTFNEFADEVLPRIAALGYNCIQLMAVKEHPYYGSFGYHVSNFFAASSRFGTPEDLKALIDKAHGLGIAVIMDAVYSHAVKNLAEGLNEFDGTDYQYFHAGGRGNHDGWDSKLFNYGKPEVLQFLLSSVRYWIEEFNFDGFRFDGVTSMLYEHHGDHVSFDHYDKYFKHQIDTDAILFLQLANNLTHSLKPGAITIAEDMSGMPGLCRPVEEGGIGFDYRLAMGIPDFWIKLLKHSADEDWNIDEIWSVLANRRANEKTIAYSESHDQALVGDKTLAFWLMDKEMYWHMQIGDDNMIIDRGIALHKMIRLISASVGGEGYLNFIGNEFGHPEWIDFPREGNDWSYKYAMRQWSLVDNEDLKYGQLNRFDQAMIEVLKQNEVLSAMPAQQLNMDKENNVIIYERNNLIFIINFHVQNAIPDYSFRVPTPGEYTCVLDSDQAEFGGHGRVDKLARYITSNEKEWPEIKVYIPNRTALVLKMDVSN